MSRLLEALLATAATLLLAACGAPDERAPRDWPAPSPALWSVTAPGGGEGWLLGTIHALPAGLAWRSPALERALAQSDVLVVEVAELDDAEAAAAAFARRARSPGLPPLLARLPPDERPALAAALDAAGLAERDFAATESWAAALSIANTLRRHDPANGVDRALIAGARVQGRPVIGLETLDGQFALFDALPPPAQARLLAAVPVEADSVAQDARVAAWLVGDLAALEREAEAGLLADPDLRERLQLARNRAWAARIAALIERGERPFVAVGAAHLLGEEGVPALLAARGFAVQRVGD